MNADELCNRLLVTTQKALDYQAAKNSSLLKNAGIPEEQTEEQMREKAIDKSLLSMEEFCETELKEAHEKGFPDPDFDFRNIYHKGDIVWCARVLPDEKELLELKLRTIYPRYMVGVLPKGSCHCISYSMRDMIYTDKKQAVKAYKAIHIHKESEE